jgi:hypothetical protein
MKRQLLHEMLQSLDEVRAAFEPSRVLQGFVDWLDFVPGTASSLVPEAIELADYEYTALAYLGYHAAIGDDVIPTITQGYERWVGRDIRRTDGEFQSFALDVIALFGIALGALRMPTVTARDTAVGRVLECLDANRTSIARDPQKSAFADVCRGAISGSYLIQSSSATSTAASLLLRLGQPVEDSLADIAIEEIFASVNEAPDGLQATLNSFCLRTLLRQTSTASLTRPTIPEIFALLGNVEAGLLRWPYGQNKTNTWEISNEYDVQSMLYLILRPLIPELKEEEWLRSVGNKKPRADLTVPSLRLLIEVKFVRGRESFNDVLGQISEDKGFYLSAASPYTNLLVFVWDDSRRTEQYAGFKHGVEELGLDGAVIVSRPSAMVVDKNVESEPNASPTSRKSKIPGRKSGRTLAEPNKSL